MNILQILPELNVGGVETGTIDFARYLAPESTFISYIKSIFYFPFIIFSSFLFTASIIRISIILLRAENSSGQDGIYSIEHPGRNGGELNSFGGTDPDYTLSAE